MTNGESNSQAQRGVGAPTGQDAIDAESALRVSRSQRSPLGTGRAQEHVRLPSVRRRLDSVSESQTGGGAR